MASFLDNLRDFFGGIGEGLNNMWNAPTNGGGDNGGGDNGGSQPAQQSAPQTQFGDPFGGAAINAPGQKQNSKEEEFKKVEEEDTNKDNNDFLKNLWSALDSLFNPGGVSPKIVENPSNEQQGQNAPTTTNALKTNDLVVSNLGRNNEKAQTFVDQNGFLKFGNPFLQQDNNNNNNQQQQEHNPQDDGSGVNEITANAVETNDKGSNGLSHNTVNDLGFVNLLGNGQGKKQEEQQPQQQEQPKQEEKKDDEDYVEYTYKPGDTFGQVILDLGLNTKKGLWGTDGDVAHYTQQLIDQGLWKNNNNKNSNIPIGTKIRLKRRKV